MADAEKIWSDMSKFRTCMLVAQTGNKLHARPMTPVLRRDANEVLFVTYEDTEKHREVASQPSVCLVFANEGDNYYLSVSGRAEPDRDRAKLKQIWSSGMQAFIPEGPDHPRVEMLRFIPESAEYWDGNSNIVTAVKMVANLATGQATRPGDNETVRM